MLASSAIATCLCENLSIKRTLANILFTGEFMAETRAWQGESREDNFTGAIEKQTSKVPSSAFLGLALGSMAASFALKIMGRDDWALFVGQWAAPFLIMGNYNKMVKQHGSDALSNAA
jgi:hypothetical protein